MQVRKHMLTGLSSGISHVDLILISVDMVNYGAEFTMHYYLEIIFGKRT